MKRLLLLIALAALCACSHKTESFTAVNPLTYTDIPDNDVIRVGDTYYMVSSTMFFCPGAPIMKSKDLAHWQICSYVFEYLEDDDRYNLRNGRNAYGKGQWATSLRYHDGWYWCLFVANDQKKTYIYKTRDIEKSNWEVRYTLDEKLYDASILFEDGRMFVTRENGDIRLIELEPDGSAVKPGGIDTLLLSSPKEGYGLRAEGSHIYHIGDYYYILEIDWPLEDVRTETCWRSKNLLGPYESKVVLKGKFDGREDGVAQGAIVDTPNGDWYAIMFQDHGAVGRIPTVQPVTWVDDWPIIGDNTKPLKEVTVKLAESGEDYVWDSDEFDSQTLALVWEWNHKPDNAMWSLSERAGFLRLKAGPATNIMDARNSLTQRTVGPRCKSAVSIDLSALKPGDRTGICAFQSHNASIGVEVAEDGSKHIFMSRRSPESGETVSEVAPLDQNQVYLSIRYVFTPQADDTCGADMAFFSYSLDGENWTELADGLQMLYTLDVFTGYRTTLFCYNKAGQAGGWADFDWFHQNVY